MKGSRGETKNLTRHMTTPSILSVRKVLILIFMLEEKCVIHHTVKAEQRNEMFACRYPRNGARFPIAGQLQNARQGKSVSANGRIILS